MARHPRWAGLGSLPRTSDAAFLARGGEGKRPTSPFDPPLALQVRFALATGRGEHYPEKHPLSVRRASTATSTLTLSEVAGRSQRMARFTHRHVGSQRRFSRCKIGRMKRCYDDEWYAERS